MAKSCCESKLSEIEGLRSRQSSVLIWVLAINAIMFSVEFYSGVVSRSSALVADSLDMFGDAAVYAFSLYAIGRDSVWRARASLSKGILMALFGVFVLGQVIYRVLSASVPAAETMTMIGGLALLANTTCLILLYRHRADDINMRSTWLCSRNDIIANVGVIGAAVLVGWTGSGLPDIVIGTLISVLFLRSALSVIGDAREELAQSGVAKRPLAYEL